MNKQLFVMIINGTVNTFLALTKIVVGLVFNSPLLFADGIHSASDLLTDIFSIIGLQLAKRPQDEQHPFGHGKLEYAASLTVSILIFIMAYELAIELVKDWNTITTNVGTVVLTVSCATFIVKLLLSLYVLRKAKTLDSHTLRTSGEESKTDAYSTIIVIIGLVLTQIGIEYNIFLLQYAEKIATAIVILMLLKTAFVIYYTSTAGIAGAKASAEVKEKFTGLIKEYITNYQLKDVIVIKEGLHYALLIQVIFSQSISLEDARNYIDELKTFLRKDEAIKKINVEFEIN